MKRVGSKMVAFNIHPEAPVTADGKAARSPRRRVLLSGQFQSLTSTHNISVRNLSSTGAAIVCDAELKLAGEGVLIAGGLDCLCRVVWRRAGIYGLKFDEKLPSSVVNDLHRITHEDVRQAETLATREWYQQQAR
jgi:hypothetical protein